MGASFKIDLTPDFQFLLVGIVSSEPFYRIVWLINEKLGIELMECEPASVYHRKHKVEQLFSLFKYESDASIYQLVHNKSESGFLLEEYKNVDYVLKINNKNELELEKSLIDSIKEIKGISMSFKIETDSLKSIQRLIFL